MTTLLKHADSLFQPLNLWIYFSPLAWKASPLRYAMNSSWKAAYRANQRHPYVGSVSVPSSRRISNNLLLVDRRNRAVGFGRPHIESGRLTGGVGASGSVLRERSAPFSVDSNQYGYQGRSYRRGKGGQLLPQRKALPHTCPPIFESILINYWQRWKNHQYKPL